MLHGVKRIYLVLMNVALFFVVAAFISSESKESTDKLFHMQPDKIVEENEITTSYYFHFGERKLSGQGIAFFSNHQNVVVYCDSARIYELQAADSIWGHTTGSVWNFVHIPFGTEDVRICLEQVYESYDMDDFSLYVGNDRLLYCSILENSMFSMACSAIIVLIGIALITVWVIVRKRTTNENNVFYLGVLALIFGLWAFNETDGAVILFENRVACSFMAFILLKVLSPTFVLFAREYVGETKRTVWNIFSRLIIIDAVITLSMQMLNIMDLKETVVTTHIILIVCIIYAFWIAGAAIKRKQLSGLVKTHILEAVIVTIAVTAVFINYFSGEKGADIVGRIGFLLFAALSASQSANKAIRMMEKGKYAAIYEELAITDSLTGLYNRNAYHIDSKKIVDLNGFMILTFDLNDLKECNDTKGHAQGDNYIITAAKMIEKLLGSYGRCYRIGGDEFCAIVRNGASCPVDQLLIDLEMEQVRYNANVTEDGYPIRIAAGYALYDEQLDDDIEEMRSRADVHMYENKRKIKEAQEAGVVV